MNRYSMFLDDDCRTPGKDPFRYPPKDKRIWKTAVSSDEAISIVQEHGIPIYMALDHDLGLDADGKIDTAMRFLHWLADQYPEAIDTIFAYSVHSKNHEGKKDIQSFMESWARSRTL